MRDREIEDPRRAEAADEIAAGLVDIVRVVVTQMVVAPAFQLRREVAVSRFEERPVEPSLCSKGVSHL